MIPGSKGQSNLVSSCIGKRQWIFAKSSAGTYAYLLFFLMNINKNKCIFLYTIVKNLKKFNKIFTNHKIQEKGRFISFFVVLRILYTTHNCRGNLEGSGGISGGEGGNFFAGGQDSFFLVYFLKNNPENRRGKLCKF